MENESKIINCIANSTEEISTPASAYGVKLEQFAASVENLTQIDDYTYGGATAYSAKWSSDANYLAIGGNRNGSHVEIATFATSSFEISNALHLRYRLKSE